MEKFTVDEPDTLVGPSAVRRRVSKALDTDHIALNYYELEAGEAIRFAPGEWQLGRNAGTERVRGLGWARPQRPARLTSDGGVWTVATERPTASR